ncbi:hypothetical protein NLJ89_g5121 [Agrocybe chaxingu]|uniref:Transmembrane protein n=1 Tax=Agrocybe chaxingu TaxID=84603 RepID=A0A9W8MTX4_9AGAR|nr:hypothetical protein NLJ89_g5121 [Agrocybe chaxingu]
MSWRIWAILLLCAALHVVGQESNVTVCVDDYRWSINSRGQTPCLVAAYLKTACGTPASVDAIPPDNHYLGPTFAQADPCMCSSVTYSVISACGGCQSRNFANWTTWSQNCPLVSLGSFPRPIPDGTEVPVWALINPVATNNTFDPVAAVQVLNGFPLPTPSSVSPLPPPVTTSRTSSTDTLGASTFTPSATSVPQTSEGGSRSNAGAIAGGVVGGLVFLAIVGLLMLWWFMRKRRNAVQKDLTFDSRALVAGSAMSQQTTGSPPDGPSPVPFSQSLYDTSDMHTYPGSPLTSAVYTHVPGSDVPGRRRSLESVSPSMIQLAASTGTPSTGQPRGFTGAAEL